MKIYLVKYGNKIKHTLLTEKEAIELLELHQISSKVNYNSWNIEVCETETFDEIINKSKTLQKNLTISVMDKLNDENKFTTKDFLQALTTLKINITGVINNGL